MEDRHACDLRNGLLEEIKALAAKFRGHGGHTRDVGARLRETGDEFLLHCIKRGCHYDGDGLGDPLGRKDFCPGRREDEIHLQLDQFTGEGGQAIEPPFCPPTLNHDVLSFNPAQLAHGGPEG
jgi:hypothetical protein